MASRTAVSLATDSINARCFILLTAKQMQMRYQPDLGEKKYTFDDIQGIDEAKEEIQEVVEFLKDPEKFQRLGARLPMGEMSIRVSLSVLTIAILLV